MKKSFIVTIVSFCIPLFTMNKSKNDQYKFKLVEKTRYQLKCKDKDVLDCSFFPHSDTFVTIQSDWSLVYNVEPRIIIYKQGISDPQKTDLEIGDCSLRAIKQIACANNNTFATLQKYNSRNFNDVFIFKYKEGEFRNTITLISRLKVGVNGEEERCILDIAWNMQGTFLACKGKDYCRIIENKIELKDEIDIDTASKKNIPCEGGVAWAHDDSYFVTGPLKQQEKINYGNITFHYNHGENSHEIDTSTKIGQPYIIKTSAKGDIAFKSEKGDYIGFYDGMTKKTKLLRQEGDQEGCKVGTIAFDPTGKYLACAKYDEIIIWNRKKKRIDARYTPPPFTRQIAPALIRALTWEKELIISVVNPYFDSIIGLTLEKLLPKTCVNDNQQDLRDNPHRYSSWN